MVSPGIDALGWRRVRITGRWSLLADGLYREMQGNVGGGLERWKAEQRVPFTRGRLGDSGFGAVYLGARRVQPFLQAGPSLRAVGNRNSDPSGYGVTAGAGVQLRAGWLNITPQVRYMRWAADRRNRRVRDVPG